MLVSVDGNNVWPVGGGKDGMGGSWRVEALHAHLADQHNRQRSVSQDDAR